MPPTPQTERRAVPIQAGLMLDRFSRPIHGSMVTTIINPARPKKEAADEPEKTSTQRSIRPTQK